MKVFALLIAIMMIMTSPALAAYKVKGGQYYEQDTLPAVLSGHGLVTRMVLDAFDLDELELEQCERTRTVPGFKLGEGILDVNRFYKLELFTIIFIAYVPPVVFLCFKLLIRMKYAPNRSNARMRNF